MDMLVKLVVFLPLFAAIINGFFCKKLTNKMAGYVASIALITSAVSASFVFKDAGLARNINHVIIASWLASGDFIANWAIYVDQLTAIMFVLVTYVSAVVHIYSLGYMEDDNNLPKFLSYLSLFTFFMLALVSADNFVQLFFGWEGVGVCSYLLIGYYFHKDSANKAAIKAFVVNRVGDMALIIGIAIIFFYVGSVEFEKVFAASNVLLGEVFHIAGYEFNMLDLACLLLFVGCMGKSAQLGLHVWLPDAMEGPTPVSALIHAATMVTAGVFLVARCSFIFEYSPLVLSMITIIGALTCLVAATIAITQSDIKKIIAYSTCSQLGYMFFACGVSAYQIGIFHLVTHGFFKALLFLSAGSVIHAVHEQDIFKMGGLRTKMPFTYTSFWLGSLAIVGVFPFAGFYSKDLVLEAAYAGGTYGEFAFLLGIVAAFLTAIYSLKIIILTFHGKTRLASDVFEHAHESPKIMNIPLLILIAGTLFSGMIGYYILHIADANGYFAGSLYNISAHVLERIHHVETLVKILPLLVGISGASLALYIYVFRKDEYLAKKLSFIFVILENKYFVDELYGRIFIKPTRIFSDLMGKFDKKIIDGIGVNSFVVTARGFGWVISQFQTGYVFSYVLYIIMALVAFVTFLLFKYYSGGSF